MKKKIAKCGVRTHAPRWEPELKSGALDRSANLAGRNSIGKYVHVHVRPRGISTEIISSGREDYKFLSFTILNT